MNNAESSDRPGKQQAPRKQAGSADAIVAAIIEDFRNGAYAPGQRLSEPDLTARFGVGRGTVREALKRLVGEGLVTITRYHGACIRSLTKAELQDTLHLLAVLISLAARQAAARLRPEETEDFRDCLEDLLAQEKSQDFYAAVRARENFFNIICRISRNRELGRVQPRLLLLIVRIQVGRSIAKETRFRDYRLIGEAILDKDPILAEFATRRHLDHVIENFESIPETMFDSPGT